MVRRQLLSGKLEVLENAFVYFGQHRAKEIPLSFPGFLPSLSSLLCCDINSGRFVARTEVIS